MVWITSSGSLAMRHADDGQREDRPAAHGIDVRERVGGGDAAEVARIVHDGHEEIGGGDDGLRIVQAIDGRVVGCLDPHQEIGRQRLQGRFGDNARQHGRRNLAASTAAVAELGQFDLFHGSCSVGTASPTGAGKGNTAGGLRRASSTPVRLPSTPTTTFPARSVARCSTTRSARASARSTSRFRRSKRARSARRWWRRTSPATSRTFPRQTARTGGRCSTAGAAASAAVPSSTSCARSAGTHIALEGGYKSWRQHIVDDLDHTAEPLRFPRHFRRHRQRQEPHPGSTRRHRRRRSCTSKNWPPTRAPCSATCPTKRSLRKRCSSRACIPRCPALDPQRPVFVEAESRRIGTRAAAERADRGHPRRALRAHRGHRRGARRFPAARLRLLPATIRAGWRNNSAVCAACKATRPWRTGWHWSSSRRLPHAGRRTAGKALRPALPALAGEELHGLRGALTGQPPTTCRRTASGGWRREILAAETSRRRQAQMRCITAGQGRSTSPCSNATTVKRLRRQIEQFAPPQQVFRIARACRMRSLPTMKVS